MKRCILFLFMSIGIASSAIAQVQPTDTDGDGYINISTLDHLRWISENSSSWDKNFELDNNINAAATVVWNDSAGFSPIGDSTTAFTGKFEGYGFAIDSLYINRPQNDYIGLFAWISNAKIYKLGITNCQIIGSANTGGLVGKISESQVSDCYSTGSISGQNNVGGFVGIIVGIPTLSNCFSSCRVSGQNSVGGLAGGNYNSIVINSYSIGSVSGSSNIGGLFGSNSNSKVSNSYSTGSVSGSENVGGLVGYNCCQSILRNCYSTGIVSGISFVGGLIGAQTATVNNCYSAGHVSGSSQVGGLFGASYNFGTSSNCFWDTQTSGQTTSNGGTGKTTAEMQTESTFKSANWDFNLVWSIDPAVNKGYPYISDCGPNFGGIEPTDTDGDGYINISTLDHLRWVSENPRFWDKNFELDNNINAAATVSWNNKAGFSPIGNSLVECFFGKFEGHGFAIDSLYINRPGTDYIGLFGRLFSTEVSNVGITNCRIVGCNYVGGIAGENYMSSVNHCCSTGSISSSSAVGGVAGGLVGKNRKATINNCYSAGRVSGSFYGIGGLVGENVGGTVKYSYSNSNVSGSTTIGGLVGYNCSSTVNDSYSTGSVNGSEQVGGLVGENNYSATVNNSYSTGSVTGSVQVGGLVGLNELSRVINSFWDTQTSGNDTSAGGAGKTTAEMKTKSTFSNASWSFILVWSIDAAVNNGYPNINVRGLDFAGIEPVDTDGDGYRNISCYSHLHWISLHTSSWDWKLELDNNINADSTRMLYGDIGFNPIGNDTTFFNGGFKGNGFAIDSLYINRPGINNIGLIGLTAGVEISDIGITNCFYIGNDNVGGVMGKSYNYSKVTNCYSSGNVTGNNYVGGLVGWNHGKISNSYSIGSVSGIGSISGTGDYVGGLVGISTNYSKVSNCYSSGNVTGNNYVGGFLGNNIEFCLLNNCYSSGNVTGNNYVGGFLGWNENNSTITNCYSNGSVSGSNYIGGLVGYNNYSSEMKNCYSTSNVSGNDHIGGFVGMDYSSETVINCYSTGSVSGSTNVGGFLGSSNFFRVSNCFWDIETSGQASSAGGTGKTTAEMKTKSTFTSAGWDFATIWSISADYNNGYPNLDGKNDANSVIEIYSNSLIYPQPATNELFVRLSETTNESAKIKLYDQSGLLDLAIETNANDGLIRLNISTLASGVYHVLIYIDGKNYSARVVVAR